MVVSVGVIVVFFMVSAEVCSCRESVYLLPVHLPLGSDSINRKPVLRGIIPVSSSLLLTPVAMFSNFAGVVVAVDLLR